MPSAKPVPMKPPVATVSPSRIRRTASRGGDDLAALRRAQRLQERVLRACRAWSLLGSDNAGEVVDADHDEHRHGLDAR